MLHKKVKPLFVDLNGSLFLLRGALPAIPVAIGKSLATASSSTGAIKTDFMTELIDLLTDLQPLIISSEQTFPSRARATEFS